MGTARGRQSLSCAAYLESLFFHSSNCLQSWKGYKKEYSFPVWPKLQFFNKRWQTWPLFLSSSSAHMFSSCFVQSTSPFHAVGVWVELCLPSPTPQIHMLKSSPPGPQNVTLFGDRGNKIKMKWLEWALIQYDSCPYKKRGMWRPTCIKVEHHVYIMTAIYKPRRDT